MRAVGNLVVLHGRTRTTLDMGGETKVMTNSFSTVWTQGEGGLMLLHWQATKLVEA